MHRYFIRLSYKGTNFSGWQRQTNAHTVQEEIEDAFQLLFKYKVNIVGCGRTDSGVHGRNYIAHFDLADDLVIDLVFKLNHIVSQDVTIHDIFKVDLSRHSRFDATSRSYEYLINGVKDSFHHEFAFAYPQIHRLDIDKLNQAAHLLFEYEDFYTFCKSKTDVKTTICQIKESQWIWSDYNILQYRVTANRFLRGMVRLIVGMCINLALDKLDYNEVATALRERKRLNRDWSVPAQGLTLVDVRYPYDIAGHEEGIKIREGSIDEVVRISNQIPEFHTVYEKEEYHDRLRNVSHLVLVAYKEEQPVGYKVGYERDDDGSFYSWMGAVLPAFRRLHIAQSLADQQEAWAAQRGYSSIRCKTKNRLKAMQRFALGNGFDIVRLEDRDSIAERIIWMEKDITPLNGSSS